MSKTLALAGLLFVGCGSSSSTADGPVSTIDARPGTGDAPSATIDARPGTGDAPVTTADAPAGATCFPQCFIDAVGTLTSMCTPSGACTTSTNPSTFTTTTCFANGVKWVSTVDLATQSVVVTTKKPNGDTCYSTTTMSTSTTSASIVWKDAGGTKLVEIDIPNIAMSNIQDYVCGSSAPIEVDLNSAICVAQRPDAGAGPDGGQGCTTDAACVP